MFFGCGDLVFWGRSMVEKNSFTLSGLTPIEIDWTENISPSRKNLGVSQGQFDQLEEEEVEEMLELELWQKDNFAVWKEEKEAEKRIKMAQSGRLVELSLSLNYSAIFSAGINSTGATWRTTAQTEWHLKINAKDGAEDF